MGKSGQYFLTIHIRRSRVMPKKRQWFQMDPEIITLRSITVTMRTPRRNMRYWNRRKIVVDRGQLIQFRNLNETSPSPTANPEQQRQDLTAADHGWAPGDLL
jgi:hypothetical protein